MTKVILRFTLTLGLILLTQNSRAWDAEGHRIIAAATWRELPASTQKHITQILLGHPAYADWKKAFSQGPRDLDLPLYAFLKASTWPDEIRRQGGNYDFPKWHYINHPLRSPKFRKEPVPQNDTILAGIAQCERDLPERKMPGEVRAVALSWLIHLVGDLHQPLHCVSLYKREFPQGDDGGTRFWIKPGTRPVSLHEIWDELLGTSNNPRLAMNEAILITARYPRNTLRELKSATTPAAWSLEGRALALEQVYRRGKLRGGPIPETAVPLPTGYTKSAKNVAERQAALASHRLCDELSRLLK